METNYVIFQNLFTVPLALWRVMEYGSANPKHLVLCSPLLVCCKYLNSFYECLMCHCHWFKCRSMLFRLTPGFCWNQWKGSSQDRTGHSALSSPIPSSPHPPSFIIWSIINTFFHFFTTIADCCSCLEKKRNFAHDSSPEWDSILNGAVL